MKVKSRRRKTDFEFLILVDIEARSFLIKCEFLHWLEDELLAAMSKIKPQTLAKSTGARYNEYHGRVNESFYNICASLNLSILHIEFSKMNFKTHELDRNSKAF